MSTTVSSSFHWKCRHTWQRSAKNTLWCLLGCSIGDFGTILFFQLSDINWPTLIIMVLAIERLGYPSRPLTVHIITRKSL